MNKAVRVGLGAAEPIVEEIPGLVEMPISGWVLHPGEDTCRIVGYIRRGAGAEAYLEPTLILHVPITGFLRSMKLAQEKWREFNTEIVKLAH